MPLDIRTVAVASFTTGPQQFHNTRGNLIAVRRELAVLPTVLVGLAAAVVGVSAHAGGAQFSAQQRGATKINPRQLDAMLMTTREPVPHGRGGSATGAACAHGAQGEKLNPWSCAVRYSSGAVIDYVIEVANDGRFIGVDKTGTRRVHGCCVVGVANPLQ